MEDKINETSSAEKEGERDNLPKEMKPRAKKEGEETTSRVVRLPVAVAYAGVAVVAWR